MIIFQDNLLEKFYSLLVEKQKEVIDFINFLKSQPMEDFKDYS